MPLAGSMLVHLLSPVSAATSTPVAATGALVGATNEYAAPTGEVMNSGGTASPAAACNVLPVSGKDAVSRPALSPVPLITIRSLPCGS